MRERERERVFVLFVEGEKKKKKGMKQEFLCGIYYLLLVNMSFCTPYILYLLLLFYHIRYFLVGKIKIKFKTSSTAKWSLGGAEDMMRCGCAAHGGTVYVTARFEGCVLMCAQVYVILFYFILTCFFFLISCS